MARAAPWLAAILLPMVLADLPVHCLHHQVLGAWELELGPPTDTKTPDCTHWAGEASSVERMQLSQPDLAFHEGGDDGVWTMVYDEGFEARVGGKRFFGFLDYEWRSDGTVHSICSRMSTGWWHAEDGSAAGCIRANLVAPAAAASPASFVEEASQSSPATPRGTRGSTPGRAPASDWEATQRPVKRVNVASKFTPRSSQKAGRLRRAQQAAAAAAAARVAPPEWTWPFHAAQLPEAFDWRNASGTDYLDHLPMRTQGDCGSCYAIAAVDMASVRLRIASGNRVKAPLSPQDAMDCSPFTQGCRGGFPFSVGKALREGGVRTEHCSAYTGRDGICPATGECPSLQPAVDDATADAARPSRSERAMHAAAASAAAVLVQTAARVGPAVGPAATGPAPERAAGSGYATHQRLWSQGAPQPGPADRVEFGDYRYIGGFYGACSEPEMRAELFHKGPIAVTIFSPDSLRYYRRGVFTHNAGDSTRARAQDRVRPTLAGTPQGADPHTPGDVAPAAVRRANATKGEGAAPKAELGDDGNVLEYRHEWEEATHSVLVVGWGVSRRGVPYWIARNEWGRQWGMKGYFHIRRGQDECAIESMAVALDPVAPTPP